MTQLPNDHESLFKRIARVLLPLVCAAGFVLVLWLAGVPWWAFVVAIVVVLVALVLANAPGREHGARTPEMRRGDPGYCLHCGEMLIEGDLERSRAIGPDDCADCKTLMAELKRERDRVDRLRAK